MKTGGLLRIAVWVLAALVGLLVVPRAVVAQALTNISGSGWPTSGTATATTVGLNTRGGAISGTNLLHVGSTDLWSGATATGYIAGDSGTALTLRIDAASGANGLFTATPVDTTKGLSGVWLRAVRTDKTLAAFTSTISYVAISNTYGSSPTVNLLGGVLKNATAPENGSGFSMFVYPGSSPNSVSAAEMGYVRKMNGVMDSAVVAGTDLVANFPFERWVYAQLEVVLGASGKYRLNINGQRVSEATVNTGLVDATVNNLSFTLPAQTGIQWQVGAMDSYRGTGHASFTTQYLSPTNYDTAFVWPCTFAGGAEGDCWTVTSSGTVTSGPRPIGGKLGFRDKTERLVAAVSSGGSVTFTSKKSIGTLPYNSDGWAWVWLRNIRYRAAAPGLVWLSTGAGTVADIRWTAQGVVNQGTSNPLCAISTADGIFDLGVCFNSDGRVRGLLVEKSFNYSPLTATTRPIVHPFVLNNWTPAALTTCVVFASTTAQTTFEFGGLAVCRRLPLVGIDSYAETAHSLVSYDYISYTGTTGTPVLTAAAEISDSATGITGQIIAAGSGATAADKWVLVYTNSTWPNGATITAGTGTLTGCAAASKVTWMGYTSSSGTLVRSDTFTEATSTATAKLITSDVLDAAYIPPGVLGLVPISGTLRGGGLTLTGTTPGPPTAVGDIPQVGCYLASHGGSYSTLVYGNLRDAEAAAVMSPYAPVDNAVPAFQVAGVFGRAGKTFTLTQAGVSFGNTPALHVWVHGGIANALNSATSSALAQTIAAREAACIVSMASEVTGAGGVFTWEMPTFGTTYMFTQSNARECFDAFIAATLRGLRGINKDSRIYIVEPGAFPASGDGVHYSPAGAATVANTAATGVKSLGNGLRLRNRSQPRHRKRKDAKARKKMDAVMQ